MLHAHFCMWSARSNCTSVVLPGKAKDQTFLLYQQNKQAKKSFVVTVLLLIIDIPAVQGYFSTERHTAM